MKLNPDNAGWAVIAALVAGGALAYVASRLLNEPIGPPIAGGSSGAGAGCGALGSLYHEGVLAGTWTEDAQGNCVLQCASGFQLGADGNSCIPLPGVPQQTNCAAMAPNAAAPYGYESDGAGGCRPKATPEEADNCTDRQIWNGTDCETPPWNRLPEPPDTWLAVWMPTANQDEFQIYTQDAQSLDALGYTTDSDGVFAFTQDFNLVNALLDEQGSWPMGGLTLNEDGILRNEVRTAMGWALSYAGATGQSWMSMVDRSEELVA